MSSLLIVMHGDVLQEYGRMPQSIKRTPRPRHPALAFDTSESAIEYTLSLEADTRSAGKARRFLRGAIDRSHSNVDVEVVTLLVSELVSNAVMYGGPYNSGVLIELRILMTGDSVRLSVRDANATPPIVMDRDAARSSGRGMQLIESYSTAWGVDILPLGKSVWCSVGE